MFSSHLTPASIRILDIRNAPPRSGLLIPYEYNWLVEFPLDGILSIIVTEGLFEACEYHLQVQHFDVRKKKVFQVEYG